eukprot:5891630-Pyramimonas_sp.AAC.1
MRAGVVLESDGQCKPPRASSYAWLHGLGPKFWRFSGCSLGSAAPFGPARFLGRAAFVIRCARLP